jgi:hypothetical protein
MHGRFGCNPRGAVQTPSPGDHYVRRLAVCPPPSQVTRAGSVSLGTRGLGALLSAQRNRHYNALTHGRDPHNSHTDASVVVPELPKPTEKEITVQISAMDYFSVRTGHTGGTFHQQAASEHVAAWRFLAWAAQENG